MAKRSIRPTTLVYCEGSQDEILVKHLRQIYSCRIAAKIVVQNAGGGAPVKIVQKAINVSTRRAFDRVIVCMDDELSDYMTESNTGVVEGGKYSPPIKKINPDYFNEET